jgi:hypothetical protein
MVFFHREKIYPQISQIPQIFLETASIYSSEAAFGDAADCSPGFQLIIVVLSRQAVARKPRSASVGDALRRKMSEMDVRFLSAFTFEKPIYRPFGAGALLNRYLGLKPQAQSYCPVGAETGCARKLIPAASRALVSQTAKKNLRNLRNLWIFNSHKTGK